MALHLLLFVALPYTPTPPQTEDKIPVLIRFQPPPVEPPPAEKVVEPKPAEQAQAPHAPAAPEPQATEPPKPEPAPRRIEVQDAVTLAPTPTFQLDTRAPTKPKPKPAKRPTAPKKQTTAKPSANQLLNSAFNMIESGAPISGFDSLNASLDDGLRHKHINRSTRELRFASYMDAWVKKVERVGNLNYPTDVRRKNLSGTLTLDVCIRRDGSVESISLLRPSEHPDLDQAAIKIVRAGAPYAPLPADIQADTDILHITRVWRFTNRDYWGSQ